MADGDSLELSLSCAICLDIASAKDAVETSCCHQLFCLSCIENVQPCPACRKQDYQTIPAYFARRLIGNLTVSCPNEGCREKITRSNLADHVATQCAFIKITCPDPSCENFKCNKNHFLEHLTSTHKQLVLDNFTKLWQKKMTIDGPDVKPTGKISLEERNENSLVFLTSSRASKSFLRRSIGTNS